MSDRELYLAIGIPALIAIFNTGVLITLLLHFTNKLDAKIETVRIELSSEIKSVRNELSSEIKSVRNELSFEIKSVRDELSSEIKSVHSELSAETRSVRDELGAKIDSGQRDMREFYATQRQHDTRLEAIERKTNPS